LETLNHFREDFHGEAPGDLADAPGTHHVVAGIEAVAHDPRQMLPLLTQGKAKHVSTHITAGRPQDLRQRSVLIGPHEDLNDSAHQGGMVVAAALQQVKDERQATEEGRQMRRRQTAFNGRTGVGADRLDPIVQTNQQEREFAPVTDCGQQPHGLVADVPISMKAKQSEERGAGKFVVG
jgi:hypothetical protein